MNKMKMVTRSSNAGEAVFPDFSLDASLCSCSCTGCTGCEGNWILYGWAAAGALTGAGIAALTI